MVSTCPVVDCRLQQPASTRWFINKSPVFACQRISQLSTPRNEQSLQRLLFEMLLLLQPLNKTTTTVQLLLLRLLNAKTVDESVCVCVCWREPVATSRPNGDWVNSVHASHRLPFRMGTSSGFCCCGSGGKRPSVGAKTSRWRVCRSSSSSDTLLVWTLLSHRRGRLMLRGGRQRLVSGALSFQRTSLSFSSVHFNYNENVSRVCPGH